MIEKVRIMVPVTLGFDAETNEYVDMIKAGIIDPTKVERVALQNAASIASLLLTTAVLITDLRNLAARRVQIIFVKLIEPPSPVATNRGCSRED